MTPGPGFNPDFEDLLAALRAQGVQRPVVGAHALAAHAVPRATGDLDVWVRPEESNAGGVVAALNAFGAPLSAYGITARDFSTPGLVYQLWACRPGASTCSRSGAAWSSTRRGPGACCWRWPASRRDRPAKGPRRRGAAGSRGALTFSRLCRGGASRSCAGPLVSACSRGGAGPWERGFSGTRRA